MPLTNTEVYKVRSRIYANLDPLKRRIRGVCQHAIIMEHIEKAILQFRPHLQQVRRAEGGAMRSILDSVVKLLCKNIKGTYL